MRDHPYLFIGGQSSVWAIHKRSGKLVWTIELRRGWLSRGNRFVTIAEGVDDLFAFTGGSAFCLNKASGDVVWERPIQSLKNHLATLAVDAVPLAQASLVQQAAAAAAAAPGYSGDAGGDAGGGDGC